MWWGWSVNLTLPGLEHSFELQLPIPPMFETRQGPVLELVFWSTYAERWIHAVSQHFQQPLPSGHIQVALGDMQWIRCHAQQGGRDGFAWAVHQLEAQHTQVPAR